jgi:hypothetical protein
MKATIMQQLVTLREAHTTTPEDAIFKNWSETYMQSMHWHSLSSELGHSDFKFG